MNIRDAQEADLAAMARLLLIVHQLHVDAEPKTYRPISHEIATEFLRKRRSEAGTHLRLAETESNLMGYCCAVIRPPSELPLLQSRKVLYVNEVVVDPTSRRKGVGHALMDDLKQLAGREHVEELELDVSEFNTEARQFFLDQDFEPVRVRMRARITLSS